MKVSLYLLVVCGLGLVGCAVGAVAAGSPMALLDVAVPPPPRSREAITQTQPLQQTPEDLAPDHSFLAVATNTHAGVEASAAASLAARIALESSLAMDESVVASASVEETITEKGQLSAEEQALVDRMIPIPKTSIPSDPAVEVKYIVPPTRDVLRRAGSHYPWPEKLQNALTTIQTAAKVNIGQIKRQAQWSTAAKNLVSQLGMKKHKVTLHLQKLTQEIKDLLGKKKQIQNKQLQDKLVERLEITHGNLKKVRRQTHNIRKNQAKMIHHKEELAHSLEGIKRSLAILKGMRRQRQFPDRGAGQKLQDKLSQFDPDLSHEAEADEVRSLQFPDAVLAELDADAHLEAEDDLSEEELME